MINWVDDKNWYLSATSAGMKGVDFERLVFKSDNYRSKISIFDFRNLFSRSNSSSKMSF